MELDWHNSLYANRDGAPVKTHLGNPIISGQPGDHLLLHLPICLSVVSFLPVIPLVPHCPVGRSTRLTDCWCFVSVMYLHSCRATKPCDNTVHTVWIKFVCVWGGGGLSVALSNRIKVTEYVYWRTERLDCICVGDLLSCSGAEQDLAKD